MRFISLIPKHIFAILDVLKFILLVGLTITFINFNIKLSEQIAAIHGLSKQQQVTAENIQKNTTTQLTALNNHINCIVDLFAQPDRTSLRIADIQNCIIVPSHN